jgi:hypothetical protein
MQERCCLGRRIKLLLGLCLLAGVCFWSAYRSGLFGRGPVAAASPARSSGIAPVTTVSATASTVPVATQPAVVADNAFPPSVSTLEAEPSSTFIALRYDNAHVIFRLSSEFTLKEEEQSLLRSLPGEAGAFEPDAKVWDSVRESFNEAHAGEQWQLEVSAGSRTDVTIKRPIILKWECDNDTYAAGFIAEVAPTAQAAFAAAPQKYFLVHKLSTASAPESIPKTTRVSMLPDWNPTPEVRSQIEPAIVAALKGEVAYERARRTYGDLPKQFEEDAALGRVKLTYEIQAFQLSPDGFPRLFVHARWMVDQERALLMNVWLRIGHEVTREPLGEEFTVPVWMSARGGRFPVDEDVGFKGLGSVVNVFDRTDGYGDLLIYFEGYEGYSIHLFRYTDAGLVATAVSQGDGC